eukprot:COSAG06_NODE_51960_length_308_cov_5.875598_1_plen_54_part_01
MKAQSFPKTGSGQRRKETLTEEKLRVRTYHISQCLPFTTTSAASSTEDALIALG